MKFSRLAAAALAILATGFSWAAEDVVSDATRDRLVKALGIKPENVRPSPIAGILEIQHERDFAYVTADGKFLFRGDLVNLENGEELTENRRRVDRLAVLSTFGDRKYIEFAPSPPVVAKYTVTVFADVDCGYCRKLHSEIAQYNAKGIAIRYAFYPRSGPDTESWRSAEAVWCSADQQKALTEAKSGATIKIKGKVCENPIAAEYELAQSLGIRGTPMLVLPNGDIFPGYLPPAALASKLAEVSAKKAPTKG